MAMLARFDLLKPSKVERVYMDNGTGAIASVSVWRAELKSIPEGAYMIGDVAIRAHTNAFPVSAVTLVKPLNQFYDGHGDFIKPPQDYELVWKDVGSGGHQNGSFWRVKAPAGYVALGDVACNGHGPPSPQFTAKYACIRSDLVIGGVLDAEAIWTDKGSGAAGNVSIWNVKGRHCGPTEVFKAHAPKTHAGHDQPSYPAYVLPAKVYQ